MFLKVYRLDHLQPVRAECGRSAFFEDHHGWSMSLEHEAKTLPATPAFQAGGKADWQWEAAVAACLVPDLLRRLTWQRLLASIAAAPELAWLLQGLREKYGLVPD
jgi:hypothetical protein